MTLNRDGQRWRIVDPEQQEAAEIVAQDKQIHWRWLAGAAGIAASQQLANCVLRFRSGDREHLLPLRKTALIEPLSLKFENGNLIAESRVALPNRPAANAVQWRVLGVTGGNAKAQLAEDAKPMRLGRDELLIGVGTEQIPELFRLGVTARWGRDLEVVAQVHAPRGPVRRALQFEALTIGLTTVSNQVALLKAKEEELKGQRPTDELEEAAIGGRPFPGGAVVAECGSRTRRRRREN